MKVTPTNTNSKGTGYYRDSKGNYYYGNPRNGYLRETRETAQRRRAREEQKQTKKVQWNNTSSSFPMSSFTPSPFETIGAAVITVLFGIVMIAALIFLVIFASGSYNTCF